ncbi:pentapeptide repeat-containing protein [Nonomuraea sp. NPDC050783]|uniref:pentapeptide repeat-containing protein n=1 Tax=Nonomuraea sp. NPDC050783 TaxID=3154634 RepID=UPI00346761DE
MTGPATVDPRSRNAPSGARASTSPPIRTSVSLNCTFRRCTFSGATFTGCELTGGMFGGCGCRPPKVEGGDRSFVGQPGADLRDSAFTGVRMPPARQGPERARLACDHLHPRTAAVPALHPTGDHRSRSSLGQAPWFSADLR